KPENDYYRQITQALAPYLLDSDIVVTRGNILDLYVPFYASHPTVFSLRNLYQSNIHPGETILLQLEHPYQRGQIIYIDALLLDEPFDPQRNPFGLLSQDIQALYEKYPIMEGIQYNGQNVFYQIGERAAPDTKTWSFEKHLGGWLEFGAANPHFENSGWCISGGSDPWIESPPLNIDAEKYSSIDIDMSIDSPAEYGQFFWRQEGEGLDESRSLRFPLESGRHRYTLDLSGWQGTIVFLRLDPVPENLEVNACIYTLSIKEN
ncbi:MAG TPA: hypothetical protein VJZ27_15520, partial [Aggregatilineales bacterium]|nr:hypothetical protein [Aggregatilineales bacterium]